MPFYLTRFVKQFERKINLGVCRLMVKGTDEMAENGFSVTENVYSTFEDDQKTFSGCDLASMKSTELG